jgi:hypothetical protein
VAKGAQGEVGEGGDRRDVELLAANAPVDMAGGRVMAAARWASLLRCVLAVAVFQLGEMVVVATGARPVPVWLSAIVAAVVGMGIGFMDARDFRRRNGEDA